MPKRTVKSGQPIPITTPLNISALARAAGVSRKTIQRRLANGWRPEAHTPAAPPRTPVAARAHPEPAPPVRAKASRPAFAPISPAVTPMPTHERPPLGVVRTVLLLVAVAFYVFVGLAAVHR